MAERCAGSVVDLFCGAGGLSHGFLREGFQITAGIDIDEHCRFPFEHNNESQFLCQDVSELSGADVGSYFTPGEPSILVGCAPCQPYSSYGRKKDPKQWDLLGDFARIVGEVKPDIVSMENVPRLRNFQSGHVFQEFVGALRDAGYKEPTVEMAYAPDYGVPQTRSRLVLLASREEGLRLLPPTRKADSYATVAATIGNLSRIADGTYDEEDPLHKSSRLSQLNRLRIRASQPGGTWSDWPEELVAPCHKTERGKSFKAVYGRMEWDAPSPTITTQFYRYGTGRFGHPNQDRALSLREGALLQSFPPGYEFTAPDAPVNFMTIGRLIGNAVPVLLATAIAESIRVHLEETQA